MFSNESQGNKYPQIHGDEVYGWNEACPGCLYVQDDSDFAPDMGQLHPEYLTDPAILLCPSDADSQDDNILDGLEIGTQDPDSATVCPTMCLGVIGQADASYVYMGWACDKLEDDDPSVPSGALQLDPPNLPVIAQVAGVLAWVLSPDPIGGGGADAPLFDGDDAEDEGGLDDFKLDTDIDLEDIAGLFTGGVPIGTGGGHKLMRLREGIERFAITDINNPAASALAQSQLVIMSDTIASGEAVAEGIGLFNHIPGGSNTLYMDGHVEFNKYPGKYPASKHNAQLTSFFG